MKHIPTIFILAVICLLSCTSHHCKWIGEAEKVVEEYPDSALTMLRECLFPERLPEAERAKYAYLKAEAAIHAREYYPNDTLLLFNTISYYKKQRDTSKWVICELYVGAIYTFEQKDQQVLFHYKEAERLGELSGSDMLPTIYAWTAGYALERRLYQISREYYRKLFTFPDEAPWAYYHIGITFSHEASDNDNQSGERDSASYYFQKCLNAPNAKEDENYWHGYVRNIAGDKSLSFEESMRMYHEVLDHFSNRSNSNTFLAMAALFMSQCQLDSAAYYIQRGEEAYARTWKRQGKEYVSIRNELATLKTCLNFALGKKDFREPITRFNDSFYYASDRSQVMREKQLDEQLFAKRREIYHLSQRQQMQEALFIIILLAVAATISVALYIRKKRNQWIETEEKVETLQQLLKDASIPDNVQHPDSYFFKRILLQQLGIIRLIATEPTAHNKDLLQLMTRIGQEELQTDTLLVWEDLYPIIDSAYDSFYSKLTRGFPGILNEKEIQLCCLLCAGFSTKEISVVTQQSLRTVYQRKTTIRQKLEMDEKEDIVEFIQSDGLE